MKRSWSIGKRWLGIRGLLVLAGVLCCGLLQAQNMVTVLVQDSSSGEGLAFVFVHPQHSTQGYFTDLDGKAELPLPAGGDSVSFVIMGYAQRTAWMKPGETTGPVRLAELPVEIDDVVILPGVNPAMRIMENAVKNRDLNNLYLRSGYHLYNYNKLRMFPQHEEQFPDTSFLRKMDLFITETATEVWTLPGGRKYERINASRLSGYPGKALPLSASDLQSVTPYEHYLAVFNEAFLSPVSPAGLGKYLFEWTDTFFTGSDSIFEIRVSPRKGEWNAVEGVLHIHSQRFAVVNLDLALVPREQSLFMHSGNIKQQYQYHGDSLWVPVHLFVEMNLLPYGKNFPFDIALSGRTDITRILREEKPPGRISGAETEVVATAGEATDSVRVNALTEREKATYRILDSLGRKSSLPWLFDQIYNLQEGRLSFGPISVDLNHIFISNRVEKGRFGLGLWTSDRVSKRISAGGWAMYGNEKVKDLDTRLKYGAEVRLTPLGNKNLVLGGGLRHDLAETGIQRVGHPVTLPMWQGLSAVQDARTFLLSRMDYQDTRFVYAAVELPGHVSLRADYGQSEIRPAFHYTFRGDSTFNAEDLSVVLRWGPGERWVWQNGHKLLKGNHLPVVYLRWGLGEVSGEQGWAETFDISEATLVHSFDGPGQMDITYRLQAGMIRGEVPLTRLYIYRGNYARGQISDVKAAFNTMLPAQFAADRYATGWLELSPHLPWLGIGRWKPRLTLSLGAAWGSVRSQTLTDHAGAEVVAPVKGFIEPGLSLRNLLPAPRKDTLLRALIKALGVGVYYNASAYNNPYWQDNLAVRVGFRL